jgi:RimJ/RimL family protein N-acetyltransferase
VALPRPATPPSDGTLELRPLESADHAAFEVLVADPAVRRFTRVPDPPPAGFAVQWLRTYLDAWSTGTRAGFAVEGRDGAWLGFAGVVAYDARAAEGELGYIVAPSARGRGVARRSLALLTSWSLGEAGLERAELVIDPANHASLRIAEQAGYVLEGTRRGSWVKDGAPRADLTVWSRLRTDPPVSPRGVPDP